VAVDFTRRYLSAASSKGSRKEGESEDKPLNSRSQEKKAQVLRASLISGRLDWKLSFVTFCSTGVVGAWLLEASKVVWGSMGRFI
jgi:hypothetical protein